MMSIKVVGLIGIFDNLNEGNLSEVMSLVEGGVGINAVNEVRIQRNDQYI